VPTAAEAQAWVPVLSQRTAVTGQLNPFLRLEAALLSSPEFFTTAGNSNQAWAAAVYTKLLRRPPASFDPNGPEVISLTGALLNQPAYAAARQTTVNVLLSSPEYRARLTTYDFQTYLNVAPSADQIAQFEQIVPPAGVQRDDYVLSVILATLLPINSFPAWLTAVYAELLHRPNISPQDPGYQFFLNFLNANQGSADQQTEARITVALQLTTSVEYRRDLVASLLNNYLGRTKSLVQTGSDPEVNAFAVLMLGGFTQEQVVSLLLTGAEYFREAHILP
jgi:hypothetical protein